MKVQKIQVKNFRQYKNLNIELPDDKRILLFVGKNGTGKSNFLNAINWCLYGNEPFGSDTKTLPVWTKSCKKGEQVEVKLLLVTEDVAISIQRIQRVGNDQSEEPIVLSKKARSADWVEEPNPRNIINRLLPEEVSRFFLFDGEHITNIFASKYGESVEEGIHRVSQIGILERALDHIGAVEDEYRRVVSRGIPDTNQHDQFLAQYKQQILDDEKKLQHNKDELTKLKDQRLKLKADQKKIDEIKGVRLKFDSLERNAEDLNKIILNCDSDMSDLLYETAPYVYLIDDLIKTKRLIDAERKKGVIPPDIRPQLIKDLIDEEECVCGRPIEKNSDEFKALEKLLDRFDLADKKSFIQDGSFAIDSILHGKLSTFVEKAKSIKKRKYDNKLRYEQVQKELKEVSDRLKNNYGAAIGDIESTINATTSSIEDLERETGALAVQLQNNKIKETECRRERDAILKSKARNDQDLTHYEATKQISEKLDTIKCNVVKRVRDIVVENTNENFKSLCWKKDFENVRVSDEYKLSVTDKNENEIFGSLSTGERKILGLSFLGALSSVSGFDAPIWIDNPFGMLDKEVQENLAGRLRSYLPGKQLFLFTLDSHITDNVSKILKLEKKDVEKYNVEYDDEVSTIRKGES